MRPTAAVLALLLPAALGCTVGPRYERPKIAVPETWTEAPAGPSAGEAELARWWTEFHDPILDRLVSAAVEGNVDLKIASARIREARAARGIAAAAGLPQVDVAAVYGHGKRSNAVPPFNSTPNAALFGPRVQDTFEAGFDASWEIDVFGGVRRDEEAALAQVEASEESRRQVLVTLLADVARSYLELRGAQEQLRILDETERSERDTLDLARVRYDAGLGTALDVARAEGLRRATEAEHPVLEVAARRAIYRLGVLVGREPAALAPELEARQPIPPAPDDVPQTLPSELLSRRPDLRRAERELAAATALSGVARADLFPRFSILGTFGRRSAEAGDLSASTSQLWSAVPAVRWPILSGGRIRANIRAQDARQEQALQGYEQAVLVALEEVENALSAHTRERAREESLRASAAANREALTLATDRYTSGLESFLSVLDAQRSVYAAEDQLARSEANAGITLIAVYKALGGGWTIEGSGSPDPADHAQTPISAELGQSPVGDALGHPTGRLGAPRRRP